MTASETTPDRPRVVTAACWTVVAGAVLILSGGVIGTFLGFDDVRAVAPAGVSDQQLHKALTFYRGSGVVYALAAVGLALLAVRTRGGDPRFRRATVGLALAVIVLIGLVAVFAGVPSVLTLLGVLPVIVGTLMLRRPSAESWFHHD